MSENGEHKPNTLDQQAGKVLIVEDEDAIRLTLRDYLVRHGHEVVVASDGVGAIRQMLDHQIAVIVTDYRMETFGGDYWIRFLDRFCRGANSVKVIVTSGFLRPGLELPFEVLNKPYEYSEIESLISRIGA